VQHIVMPPLVARLRQFMVFDAVRRFASAQRSNICVARPTELVGTCLRLFTTDQVAALALFGFPRPLSA
jgi:hypothetical protein